MSAPPPGTTKQPLWENTACFGSQFSPNPQMWRHKNLIICSVIWSPLWRQFLTGLEINCTSQAGKNSSLLLRIMTLHKLANVSQRFSCLHDFVKQCFLHLYDVAQNSLFQNWHSQSCKMQSQSAPFKHISRSPLAASHRPHLPSHSHHSSLIAWLLWSMWNPLSHSSTYYWGHPTPGCYVITCWVS